MLTVKSSLVKTMQSTERIFCCTNKLDIYWYLYVSFLFSTLFILLVAKIQVFALLGPKWNTNDRHTIVSQKIRVYFLLYE